MSATLIAMPEELTQELRRMRRDPEEFTVLRALHCSFCTKTTAVTLGHPMNPVKAGTWCPTHGWLFFDSVKITPIGEQLPKRKKLRKAA